MTAYRRIRMKTFGAALLAAMGLSLPAAAQNAQQPVDVTAAPPPSPDTVGPSQLRDFSLGGPSTRPAPSPAQPNPSAPAQQTQPSTSRPEPATIRSGPADTADSRPDSIGTPAAATPLQSEQAPPTRSLPLEVVTESEPAGDAEAVAQPAELAPSSTPIPDGETPWPWISALLAAIMAAAVWWSMRRGKSQRHSDPGRLAFAGGVSEREAPGRELDVRPRALPTPPPATPRESAALPVPQPKPVIKAKLDGLITSTALKPQLEVRFVPDRVVVTDREVIVQFDVIVANVGSAAARNVLVEALLVSASPTQDQEIAQFFRVPRALGDRVPGIGPMDTLTLKSAVRRPIEEIRDFDAGGRKLFVPLVAFNILYGVSDQQVSASFLVGRGKEDDEKLAPFRLDLGPRIFRGLAGRPHSSGLSAAA